MRKHFFAIVTLLILFSLTPAQDIYNSNVDYLSIEGLKSENEIVNYNPNNQEERLTEITTFPNPSINEVYIKIKDAHGQVKVDIYNTIGKLVKLSRISKFEEDYLIDVSDLCNGIYFLNIKDAKSFIKTQKLVIERN